MEKVVTVTLVQNATKIMNATLEIAKTMIVTFILGLKRKWPVAVQQIKSGEFVWLMMTVQVTIVQIKSAQLIELVMIVMM